jgi:putative oxidoreductase
MKTLLRKIYQLLSCGRFVAELATRLTVGYVFAHSGYGKLTHLDKVIAFFESLHIPAPQLQAPFVAAMEFLCGLAVLLGVATRLVSVPLIVIMLVAIRTARWDDITDLSSLFATAEYLYIVLLFWLITAGPGKISVDAVLEKKFWGRGMAS